MQTKDIVKEEYQKLLEAGLIAFEPGRSSGRPEISITNRGIKFLLDLTLETHKAKAIEEADRIIAANAAIRSDE